MTVDLVVGVDAGGTGSRAVVATIAGSIVGRGTAGPGNPLSGGVAAVESIAAALRSALTGSDPSAVVAGVLGVAGTSVFVDPSIAAAFRDMWGSLGLRCPQRFVGDVITAFAAGTPEPSGAVLIAGTGAVAARIAGHSIVRLADGLGWLLGDEGSGRWMGLQALRAAVRDWSSPLASDVAAHTGVTSADALIRWAQALPMAEFGALAPVVCAAARRGDTHAATIVTDAVAHLLTTLDEALADDHPASTQPAGAAARTHTHPTGAAPSSHAHPTSTTAPGSRHPTGASGLARTPPTGDVAPARTPTTGTSGLARTPPTGDAAPADAHPSVAASSSGGRPRGGPIVLAGGLLVGSTPVQDGVLEALRARDLTARLSRDPAAAAAWLAALPLSPLAPADLHALLLGRGSGS